MKIGPTHRKYGPPLSTVSKEVPTSLLFFSKEPRDRGSEGTSQQIPLTSQVMGT